MDGRAAIQMSLCISQIKLMSKTTIQCSINKINITILLTYITYRVEQSEKIRSGMNYFLQKFEFFMIYIIRKTETNFSKMFKENTQTD